jgi:cytochrome c oxidase cbb3-type subunit 2
VKHPVGRILLPLVVLLLASLVSDSSAREPQAASRPDPEESDNTQAGPRLEETQFGGGLEANPGALATTGPQAEQLTDWGDVLELLPKDAAGGVDWVRAVKEGVIAPRPQLPSAPPPEAPFRLDSLAQVLNASGENPLLLDLKMLLEDDVKLVPRDAPFFEVRFPHSSHLLWLNCSSCHPWILGKRGVGMEAILEGDYCGKCHGKVSYHPETACSRCHVNLHYPEEELAQADMAAAGEDPVEATPELVERGRERYETFCVSCHGEEGDGAGDLARFMDPKPRDFTEGVFKFRTTASGSLPQDIDIYRTIAFGVKKSSMPAWFALPSRDRWALVHYVKTFSEYFEEEEPDEPIEIPEPPPVNSELLALGAEMFAEMQCWDCHGSIGKGDGAAAGTLEDDWGFPIRPADFTQGVFKAGNTIGDIYRTVATGLDGTPMPSFGDILEEEQLWAVTYYVRSLATEQKGFGMMGDTRFPREVSRLGMPAAVFPHWFHRIRFKCSVCHPAIFRMERGANPVSMDGIGSGEWCGKCHNGRIAWPAGFHSCNLCHRS